MCAAVHFPPIARCSSHVSEAGGEKRREVIDLQQRFVYLRVELQVGADSGGEARLQPS
jgi:hypothetical protein